MLNIFIDSCADLSQQLIAANGLRMIPLHVLVDGKDHYDSDLNLDQLFASEEITGELPKTSAPSFLEFVNFFDVEGPVIFIGISSQLSATMKNAQLAPWKMPPICW